MRFDFSSIDKIVERQSDILVEKAKEYDWPVKNLHKKDYFDVFESMVNENSFWIGNPDSFKVAACLIAALIEKKPLQFEVNNRMPSDIVLYNYRLAVNVALEFLSTTKIHTYTADRNGKFVKEQNHPSVEMEFPVGIIEAEEMYISLCKSLANTNLKGYPTNVSTISIILHLLYCYCINKEKNN